MYLHREWKNIRLLGTKFSHEIHGIFLTALSQNFHDGRCVRAKHIWRASFLLMNVGVQHPSISSYEFGVWPSCNFSNSAYIVMIWWNYELNVRLKLHISESMSSIARRPSDIDLFIPLKAKNLLESCHASIRCYQRGTDTVGRWGVLLRISAACFICYRMKLSFGLSEKSVL